MKTNKLTDEKIKNVIFVFLLFTITISVFEYTVKIRKLWFGTLSAYHHQWLSGTTLKFSKNWCREGPFKKGDVIIFRSASGGLSR